MSKVKNITDELCTSKLKGKYRSSLRRIESEHIKKIRMENAKRFGYGYRYYIKNSLPRKPYLKVINERKKWLKRQAARKVRKAPQDDLLNHGDYKRLYDLWWMLW